MDEKLGIIGLGKMGLPLSRQLLADGHTVCGYDVDLERMNLFVDGGGSADASAKEVADRSDITFSILMKPEHIEETPSARTASSQPEKPASFMSR